MPKEKPGPPNKDKDPEELIDDSPPDIGEGEELIDDVTPDKPDKPGPDTGKPGEEEDPLQDIMVKKGFKSPEELAAAYKGLEQKNTTSCR